MRRAPRCPAQMRSLPGRRSKSGSTYGLTRFTYDALGRATRVTHPDGAVLATTYTGPATQVTDEGNGQLVDGLNANAESLDSIIGTRLDFSRL